MAYVEQCVCCERVFSGVKPDLCPLCLLYAHSECLHLILQSCGETAFEAAFRTASDDDEYAAKLTHALQRSRHVLDVNDHLCLWCASTFLACDEQNTDKPSPTPAICTARTHVAHAYSLIACTSSCD